MSLASYHCSTPGSRFLGLASAMSAERSRRRKLAELVSDHVFGHVQPGKLSAVVNQERHADKLGNDRAVAGPRLERLALAQAAIDLGSKAFVHVRTTFLNLFRPTHSQ